ncbi:MAG: hypothetical protein ACI4XB_04965 [Ruminococcus sp.]
MAVSGQNSFLSSTFTTHTIYWDQNESLAEICLWHIDFSLWDSHAVRMLHLIYYHCSQTEFSVIRDAIPDALQRIGNSA